MTQQGIEVFLAVAKLGSVSAAAQSLYITQPAVSRHLHALEEDLNCMLFVRGRGKRQVELTPQGRDFVPMAEKWQLLWREAREVTGPGRTRTLRVASVGSLSTYLLPPVFREFLAPGRALTFHNYHSREAYSYVAQGLVDIALISDHMYHPQVETVPAFRSSMVLVTGPGLPWPDTVHPSQLDPSRELRLPWNPEYDLWHDFWFQASDQPRATLDMMPILEQLFLWEQCWAVAPLSVGRRLVEKAPVRLHRLEEGPPERIIYYLQGRRRKPELVRGLLACLREELAQYDEIEVFL